MPIKRYDEFLLESVIRASKDFMNILSLIKDNSKVAQKLIDLLGQDVKTNYNFIKISEDPSKLSFMPDNQAERKLSAGMTEEDLFAAASNPTTVGRLVKSIFGSNGIPVTDGELDYFGILFKSYATLLSSRSSVRVVSGEEVRKWYHEGTYAGRPGKDGTLNKSCMRYDDCADFFDIYTKNPDVVEMLIKLDDEGKLEARGLLWQTNMGPYLDRVYSINPDMEKLVELWAESRYDRLLKFNTNRNQRLEVSIKPHRLYGAYPYMDTFCYYLRDGEEQESVPATLYNYQVDTNSVHLYYLHDTEGNASRMDSVYCEYHDEEVPRHRAVYSDSFDSWIRDDRAVESEYLGGWLPEEEAVRSEACNSYLSKEDSVEVVVGEDGETDWYPANDKKRFPYWLEQTTGMAYSRKMRDQLLLEWEGEYYDMTRTVFVKELTEAGKAAYKAVYGAALDFCTKLDEKVFGFETTGEEVPVGKEALTKRQYAESTYKSLVGVVRGLDISAALKREKLAELAESDKLMRAKDEAYRLRNYTYERYGGREGLFKEWAKAVGPDEVKAAVADTAFKWLAESELGRTYPMPRPGPGDYESRVGRFVVQTRGGRTPGELLSDCVANPALVYDDAFLSKHVDDDNRPHLRAAVYAAARLIAMEMDDKRLGEAVTAELTMMKQHHQQGI